MIVVDTSVLIEVDNGNAAADGLIAATAAAYGRRVLTADAGFRRYPGLEVEWVEPRRRVYQ